MVCLPFTYTIIDMDFQLFLQRASQRRTVNIGNEIDNRSLIKKMSLMAYDHVCSY